MIDWSDFEKIDIRAGTILEAHDFPKARKPAYQLKIDFGAHGIKNASAQVTQLYTKDELLGRQIVAVLNFPPKQIGNFFSECLVLGIYNKENDVVLLQPSRPVANGDKIG